MLVQSEHFESVGCYCWVPTRTGSISLLARLPSVLSQGRTFYSAQISFTCSNWLGLPSNHVLSGGSILLSPAKRWENRVRIIGDLAREEGLISSLLSKSNGYSVILNCLLPGFQFGNRAGQQSLWDEPDSVTPSDFRKRSHLHTPARIWGTMHLWFTLQYFPFNSK